MSHLLSGRMGDVGCSDMRSAPQVWTSSAPDDLLPGSALFSSVRQHRSRSPANPVTSGVAWREARQSTPLPQACQRLV
ncbi:hypothetical protein VTN96DRAFT_1342 [Rasamsonia emersonii]